MIAWLVVLALGPARAADTLAPLNPAPKAVVVSIADLARTHASFSAEPHPLLAWLDRSGLDPTIEAHRQALAPAIALLSPGFEERAAAEYNEAGGSMSTQWSAAADELQEAARKADAEDPALRGAIDARVRAISQDALAGRAGAEDAERAAEGLRLLAIYPKGSNAYLAVKSLARTMRAGSPEKARAAARDILRALDGRSGLRLLPRHGDEAPPQAAKSR